MYPRPHELLLITAVACVATAGSALAQGSGTSGNDPQDRDCEARAGARLAFLEQRLEGNAGYARWWWRGWTGVYTGGIVFEGVRAALEDDRGERANSVASAVKSAIGLGRAVLSPPAAMRGLPDDTPEGADTCFERVERAEKRLRESAEQAAEERRSWIPHLANLGLNAAAAVVVGEMYDEESAYWSGLLGFAVGEVRIWTYPWQAEDDWQAYETRFETDARGAADRSWHLELTGRGARLVVVF